MRFTGRSLAAMICLTTLLPYSNEQSCTLVTIPATKANERDYEDKVNVADEQACLDLCLSRANCKFVEYRDPSFCLLDEDGVLTQLSDPANTLYEKQCGCSSIQTADTDGDSPTTLTVALTTSAQCEEACRAVIQCQAYVFTASQTCTLYSSEGSPSTSTGGTYGKRKACTSGKSCCFDQLTDSQGGSGEIASLSTSSVSSCETLCLKIENCLAMSHDGSTCSFFTETPTKISSTGVVLYEKTEIPDCQVGFQFTEACKDASTVAGPRSFIILIAVAALLMLW